jgi:thiamine pyrophosphokinase
MKILIVADSPKKEINFNPDEFDIIIALDGAAELLKQFQIMPHHILGDLDTINSETINFFQNTTSVITKIPDQNSTDLDKGILFAKKLGATEITIINALYGRMDHTLYNTRVLKKHYDPKINIEIWNENEKLIYCENTALRIIGTPNSPVAILSFPSCTITSNGLTYDMQEYKLEFGQAESTCNSFKTSSAEIFITGSALLIVNKETNLQTTLIS